MREVTVGRHTKVLCLDEPGAGGACHEYQVVPVVPNPGRTRQQNVFAEVNFQNGAIKESGVNGCQNEDLLAIVVDRLQGFQSGQFTCGENEDALHHLNKALEYLRSRTDDRIKRGVEGMPVK